MADLGSPLEQGQASPEALPTPYANAPPPKPMSEAASAALEQAGQLGGRWAVQHQEQMNAAHIAEGETAMMTARSNALDDPDHGFRTQRGLAARDALPDYEKRLSESYQQIVKQAPNPAVARALSMRGLLQMSDFRRQASEHALSQEEAYKANQYNERVRVGVSEAIGSWADPDSIPKLLARTKAYVDLESARQGDPRDEAGRWRNVQKEVAKGVLDQLLVHHDIPKTEQFLGQVKELLGPEAARYEGELTNQRNRVASVGDTIKYASDPTYRKNQYGVLDLGAVEDDLAKRIQGGESITPERYEQTLAMVRQRNAAGREAEQVATNHAFQVLMGTWQQGGMDHGGDEAVARSPDAQAAMKVLLDPDNESGAERLVVFQRQVRAAKRGDAALDRQLAAEARREQVEANQSALDRFHSLDMRGTDGQDQYTVDINKAFPDVDARGREALRKAQAAVKKDIDKNLGESRTAFKDEVLAHARQQGYGTGDTKRFTSYMVQQYDAWKAANPTKSVPTRDEVDRMLLDAQAPEGGVGGWFQHPRWRSKPGEQPVAAPAPQAAPKRVNTPEEARKLPKGTHFVDPSGVERVR